MVERAVLKANPGTVQVIAKVAGCSSATAKALLVMEVADRKMSKLDVDRARVNFEELEWRTAKRVLGAPKHARQGTAACAGACRQAGSGGELDYPRTRVARMRA